MDFLHHPPIGWSEANVMRTVGNNAEINSIDVLFQRITVCIVSTYVYPKVIDDAMNKYPERADSSPNEISLLKKPSSFAITDPNKMLFLAGITRY